MSKKQAKRSRMQAATAIARQKSGSPSSDNSDAELPEKLVKAGDGPERWHQAFATADVNLGACLRLQAMLAAGGSLEKQLRQ